MRRFALLSVCMSLLVVGAPTLSFASKRTSAKADPKPVIRRLQLAYGWTVGADGQKHRLPQISIPIALVPIDSKPMHRRSRKSTKPDTLKGTAFGDFLHHSQGELLASLNPAPRPAAVDSEVYVSDSGGPYIHVSPDEFVDPSSLDGITMVNGAGAVWTGLKLACHNEAATNKVLFRFIGYTTYNPGAPQGTPAFTNWFVDAGFYIENVPAGTFRVEAEGGGPIPIASQGINSPTNTFYLAMQWRQPNTPPPFFIENGEGAFNENFYNVYSTVAPSLGSSADNYWYDWLPLDGIYTNEELEILGDGTGTNYPSNFFFRLWANQDPGTTETLVPFEVTFPAGSSQAGNFTSLWTSNDQYVTLKRGIVLNPTIDPMQVAVKGIANSENANSIKFRAELGTTTGGSPQKIYLFNYSTNQYDLVDSRSSTTADSVVEITVTNNPTRYINQTQGAEHLQVKALITFRAIITLNNSWNARIDQAVWIVNRP